MLPDEAHYRSVPGRTDPPAAYALPCPGSATLAPDPHEGFEVARGDIGEFIDFDTEHLSQFCCRVGYVCWFVALAAARHRRKKGRVSLHQHGSERKDLGRIAD